MVTSEMRYSCLPVSIWEEDGEQPKLIWLLEISLDVLTCRMELVPKGTRVTAPLMKTKPYLPVSNSCVNPLLYGSYAKSNWTNVFKKCFSPKKEENQLERHLSNSRQTIIIASGGSSHRSKIIYTGTDINHLD